jgi:beta-ketodecanoyl-[acyl-carrier-protein] synthase
MTDPVNTTTAGLAPPIITGRGMDLPPDVLSNHDLSELLDGAQLESWIAGNRWCQQQLAAMGAGGVTAEEMDRRRRLVFEGYVRQRVGIENRRVIDRQAILDRRASRRGVFGSTLGALAAERALAAAALTAADVDLVVCGTSSPDRVYPTTAVEIQGLIGATGAAAFDVLAACSSFVFALETARALVAAGGYRRALVVAAEFFTCAVDYSDPANSCFWGDAGAAVVVEAAELGRPKGGYEILSTLCRSQHSQNIRTGLGGTRPWAEAVPGGAVPGEVGYRHFYQNGPRVYREVIPLVHHAIEALLRRQHMTVEEVRAFMFHQASSQMIGGLTKRLFHEEPPADRVPRNLRSYGNTSSCGAAICLVEDTTLQPGEIACMCAFGGGYTVGAALLRKVAPLPAPATETIPRAGR